MMLYVTGRVVNLRRGPGIDYYRVTRVQQGDQLQVTGRNADASWLQVVDPNDPAAWLWISRGLTDLRQGEAKVDVAEVEIPLPPPVRAHRLSKAARGQSQREASGADHRLVRLGRDQSSRTQWHGPGDSTEGPDPRFV